MVAICEVIFESGRDQSDERVWVNPPRTRWTPTLECVWTTGTLGGWTRKSGSRFASPSTRKPCKLRFVACSSQPSFRVCIV